jgi:phospholipid-transporting ATPase
MHLEIVNAKAYDERFKPDEYKVEKQKVKEWIDHALDSLKKVQDAKKQDAEKPGSVDIAQQKMKMGLVVDRASCKYAMTDELKPRFLDLSLNCEAVVCCRVDPIQKGDVVDLVRNGAKKITLAIGDGANDVPMIQRAHLGVGISGQEGMQAVMASDYAIAQFRFLKNLTLHHGRRSYWRLTLMVSYFFYKNIVLTVILFWHQLYTGFSGQRLFDDYFQALYNVMFTALPILAFATFEQDVPFSLVDSYPQLYMAGQGNKNFSFQVFFSWQIFGLLQSLVCFFVPYACYVSVGQDGLVSGMWSLGTLMMTCVVIVVNLVIMLETRFWTGWNAVFYFLTVASFFAFVFIYCGFKPGALGSLDGQDNMFYVIFFMMGTARFWLVVVLTVTI